MGYRGVGVEGVCGFNMCIWGIGVEKEGLIGEKSIVVWEYGNIGV
jgi:hypothetical protein